ncbi:MAG: 2-oxoglutarate dehydrogenase E1 component, partial [Thiothrix sp.]|nr:2-oxoglutarate dehydrogenase E1 component [Thiothrix sp.]
MSLELSPSRMDESFLDGEHAMYLDQVYRQYQQDPDSVSAEWQQYFRTLERQQAAPGRTNGSAGPATMAAAPASEAQVQERRSLQARVMRLINAYRYLGHLEADTNPLGNYAQHLGVPELSLEKNDLDKVDLDTVFDPGSFNITETPTLGNICSALQETYVRTLGFEYMHIMDVHEKRWLQQRIESNRAHDP